MAPRHIAMLVVVLSLVLALASSQALSPQTNPQKYPWADIKLIGPDNLSISSDPNVPTQVGLGTNIQLMVRFNVILESTLNDYFDSLLPPPNGQPSTNKVLAKISWALKTTDPVLNRESVTASCALAGPTSTSSDPITTNPSTFGDVSTLTLDRTAVVSLGTQTMIRGACLITASLTVPSVANVFSQFNVLGQPLPLYQDSNAMIAVRPESIRLRRSADQSLLYAGYKSAGVPALDPNPLYIPVDGQKYMVDIIIDVLAASQHNNFFVKMPTRGPGLPFKFVNPSSLTCQLQSAWSYCGTLPAQPVVVSMTHDTDSIPLLAVQVLYTDCAFTCQTAVIAADVYATTNAEDVTPESPIPPNMFLLATAQSSTTPAPAEFTAYPYINHHQADVDFPVYPFKFTFTTFPVAGIIASGPASNTNNFADAPAHDSVWKFFDSSSNQPSQYAFSGLSLFSGSGSSSTFNPEKQSDQYVMLDNLLWSFSHENGVGKVIFSHKDGQSPLTEANFPFALFANAAITMNAFHYATQDTDDTNAHSVFFRSAPSDSGSSGIHTSLIQMHYVDFAGTDVRTFESHTVASMYLTFNDDQNRPVRSADGLTFAFPFTLNPSCGNGDLACKSQSKFDLSNWVNAGGNTYTTTQKLLVNGHLILPKTPLDPDSLFSRVSITYVQTPSWRVFTSVHVQENDNGDIKAVPLSPWTTKGELDYTLVAPEADQIYEGIPSGTPIFINFEFDKDVVLKPIWLSGSESAVYWNVEDFDPRVSQYLASLAPITIDLTSDATNSQPSPYCNFHTDTSVEHSLRLSLNAGMGPTDAVLHTMWKADNDGYVVFPDPKYCRFPITPTGVTGTGVFMIFQDDLTAPLQAWMPRIIPSPSDIGISHTRPYFLNQINFGTLRIKSIPIGVTAIRLFYRDIQFRPSDSPAGTKFFCLNDDYDAAVPAKFKYTGNIITTVIGTTSTFKLQFDTNSLERLQEDVAFHPDIRCSSIPLIVQKYNGDVGLLQISTDGSAVPFAQQIVFPPTYAMRVSANLIPGRVSTITFTVQSSVPGTWIIDIPYGVELDPDTTCVSTTDNTVEFGTISYKSNYMPTADECAAWGRSPGCYPTAFAHALIFQSTFSPLQPVLDDETPQTQQSCTFTATRRFSSSPSAKTLGSVSFAQPPGADSAHSVDLDAPASLANFRVSTLLPAIGYLPPVVEFSIITVTRQTADQKAASLNPNAANNVQNPDHFDILHIDIYNAELAQGATITLASVSPLTTSEVATFTTIRCTHSTDDAVTTYDGTATSPTYFLTAQSKPGDSNTDSQFVFTLAQKLEAFERLTCDLYFPYSTLPVKKPQTAVLSTSIASQGEYSDFVYLPPITSTYVLSSLSAGAEIGVEPGIITADTVTGTGQFGFQFQNTGVLVRDPQFFAPFSDIALPPVNNNPDSTFSCFTRGPIAAGENPEAVPAITSYSRLTDYTLQISPTVTAFTTGATYNVVCTFKITNNAIVNAESVDVTVSVYEPESGQYNLNPYTMRYSPPTNTPRVNQAGLVLRWVNPPLTQALLLPQKLFDTIGQAFDLLLTLSNACPPYMSPEECILVGFGSAGAGKSLLEKFQTQSSSGVLLTRKPHFRSITSLTDPYASPGASSRITADQIQDLATVVSYPDGALVTAEIDLLVQIFSSDRSYWSINPDLAALQIRPLDRTPMYNNKWPSTCFVDNRCGVGCPVPCANDQPCKSDFECASNFCALPEDSTSTTCLTKDFSTFPSTFFSEYRVKK